jgi:hypothetical protein
METARTKAYHAYHLVHQANPESEPVTQEFGRDEYFKAREAYLLRHELDTDSPRQGHFTTGLFPHTQLYWLQYDGEHVEVKRRKVLSNKHQPYPFGRMEPLAKVLMTLRNAGKEWFVEDDDQQREFFATENDALAFAKAAHPGEKWQLFNMDKYLDAMEGRSIQHFLHHRSALSTNQLEVLADLGRGTLSKIKNGQRVLSRKQYGRIIRVLQHYGYVAWVDLRGVGVAG